MFKFSFEWLKDYCDFDISPKEAFDILNLQGFEFQGKEHINSDIVTAIEVKANRPDMLYHMGIAREINAYKNKKLPCVPRSDMLVDNKNFPVKINVKDPKICKRYCAVILEGIDNKAVLPEYITNRLSAMGINSVNPVVDIANYVMLDMGQPLHSYDFSKISGSELNISKSKSDLKITTLGEKEDSIPSGSIMISDSEHTLCVAGIIGTNFATVTSDTQKIVLESAVFNEVDVRITSRASKISTPSSFRFERGVNADATKDILSVCAEMILKICGGKLLSPAFDYYPNEEAPKEISLDLKRVNLLLGTSLTAKQVVSYLEKYEFKCTIISDEVINVVSPRYRLDILQEADLIEEIARMYGYDNIPAVMPTTRIGYTKNEVWNNKDKIRDILIGLNFSEVINYSFIPFDTMERLGISRGDDMYSDILLQNPISNAYSLMRPTLVYSLLNSLAYNYSIKNTNLALFELGRTYFRNDKFSTGCEEKEMCGFAISGVRIPRGWGNSKDIKYNYYDIISYLDILMSSFGNKFELKAVNYNFFESGSGYEIFLEDTKVGVLGKIDKKCFGFIKNLKLVKDDIFYCEFRVDKVNYKSKKLKFESKYPPVNRLYNFVQNKNITAEEVIASIKSVSEMVKDITVKDIYHDKNMGDNEHAVLYEINYCSKFSTLTLEAIEDIENEFMPIIESKFGLKLKDN